MNTLQQDDFTVSINADDKLFRQSTSLPETDAVKYYTLIIVERWAYASVHNWLGWLGTAESSFCATYALLLQQRAPSPSGLDLIEQAKSRKQLKRIGTRIGYPRPTNSNHLQLSVFVFADASRSNTCGQREILAGLFIDEIQKDCIFNALSWLSHKLIKPTKSVPAAHTLAASEAIDHW